MKSIFVTLSILILFILTLGAVKLLDSKKSISKPQPVTASASYAGLNYTTPISIDGVNLMVAVANTDETRAQGLSGQQSLKDGQGVLFDFKNSSRKKPGFWMKDMNFAIDILWIRNNIVVDVTENIPAPNKNQSLSDLPLYYPDSPIDTVVEVPAGWCKRNNVDVGAVLKYSAKK